MTKQVLFIHSAGPQNAHEGSDALKGSLVQQLGNDYEWMAPPMPFPEDPKYAQWKAVLDESFASMHDGVVLIGHSLGGSVLLKYLSEEKCHVSISALCLIASPFWGVADWRREDFVLCEDFGTRLPTIPHMYFYQSKDDDQVPDTHMVYYAEKIRSLNPRLLSGKDHLFQDGLPELVTDLKQLQ
ncbi:alpha/beta hydrolase [Geomicrobium sp. JCM 19055]|uniref:alpha/beta hydrolase n=1 Tax=Geomicrobium sp. JCM 19055 TaxID=1460649 RepID=UPI00045ED3E8|nr:alpha/beta hydrolase [Geomicrobium sp. JCM 19055]GAK01132.1 hypothetical protein JCM19055_4280 [Geomicrobium sp. JCM 19055]